MKKIILAIALIMGGLALQVNLVRKPYDMIGSWLVTIGLTVLSICLYKAFDNHKN